ncbi:DUF1189 domain-containing protein [Clostridium fungisolvens]|uniref:DUF1189 domain-containing protein n=1 Tax=Clostridium fungisolvens TaxID=1604897 RepID=A0A6V8SM22_9CLOT|nr:DUF1189 domain-containing protein [Clostridium fungisolvens]GFP78294.1 hypothetical protein bsdtw1_04511 [Clostridium fungisolvens]
MDKNVPFFIKIYNAMAKPKFYIKFNELSFASAIIYLFTISIIFGFISYIRPTYNYYKFMDTIHNEVVYEFPEFTFNNGILEVDGKQPILLKRNDYNIVIDTTGKTGLSKIEDYDKAVLILKDKAYIKNGSSSIDETRYSIIKFLKFNKAEFIEAMYDFKAGAFIMLASAPVLFFLSNLFTAFMVSAVGTLINSVLKAGIKYINLYKLSLYAITTAVIISCIRRVLALNIVFINYIYLIISSVYMFLAIRNILITNTKNIEE